MYDLIIIGAGPAGITASVYAARKRMEFLIISEDIGGQAAWSGDIENYTGYQFVTGPELAAKFQEHMEKYDIEIKEEEKVIDIKKAGDLFEITTGKNKYSSKTVIIASGKRSRELGVPGETEFKNRGLTYCATCDGPLFSGKDVAVIGGGNSALDAALQLERIANKIYLINNTSSLQGDEIMREKVQKSGKVKVFNKTNVVSIKGDTFTKEIIVNQEKEISIPVQGVFVEIGLIPNSEFTDIVKKNEIGEIKVNSSNETNTPGIYAAGDVTDVPEKQIIVAAGEGAKAALSIFKYLAKKR